MWKRVVAAGMALTSAGCASYELPTGAAAAQIMVREGVGNTAHGTLLRYNSGPDFQTGALMTGGLSMGYNQVSDIEADKRAYIEVRSTQALGVGSWDCTNLFSFVPERDRIYVVVHTSILYKGCSLVLLDDGTNTVPESFRSEGGPGL